MSILMLSYAEQDAKFGDSVAGMIRGYGIDCVTSPKVRDWAASSTEEFDEFLLNCLSFVFILSSESLDSQWMPYEVGYARGREKHMLGYVTPSSFVVPGYLSGCEIVKGLDDLCAHLKVCRHAARLRHLASDGS